MWSMTGIESSHIKSASYDPNEEVLIVEFHKGGSYRYTGVPASLWRKWLSAKSVGEFFHQNIREFYRSTKESE